MYFNHCIIYRILLGTIPVITIHARSAFLKGIEAQVLCNVYIMVQYKIALIYLSGWVLFRRGGGVVPSTQFRPKVPGNVFSTVLRCPNGYDDYFLWVEGTVALAQLTRPSPYALDVPNNLGR